MARPAGRHGQSAAPGTLESALREATETLAVLAPVSAEHAVADCW
ncbi:hypothetical protein STAFG_7280 [Streptomyces afghaniensis 772]|uniref:Uncharacterized protein n=1 Tax=Streptomyces afghaniensis 772 TaxID=1283301 RepID=S4NC04_9ACTN|nr:hypothetical protein STAFG_7280 [Streptomyces afghaniensis 772]